MFQLWRAPDGWCYEAPENLRALRHHLSGYAGVKQVEEGETKEKVEEKGMKKTAYNLAKLKKRAAQLRKLAASPQLGIFWIDEKNDIMAIPQPFVTIPNVGGFRTAPENHITEWWKVQKNVRSFQGKDYDSVPRGRVTYNEGTQRFQLILPPHLTGDQTIIKKVMKTFGLPANRTVVMSDMHYRLRDDQISETPKTKTKSKTAPAKGRPKKKPVSVFDLPDGFDDPEWDD